MCEELSCNVSSTPEASRQEKIDEGFMRRAIELARCGEAGAAPNPMVGAVVVCDGRIIGEGYHRKCGGPHAEVNAIRSVRDEALLRKSTIYVSLEPCAHWGKTPPCADLIVEKQFKRVVVGCQDPFAKVNGLGIKKIKDAGIEVKVGVLERECLELNRVFVTYHSKKRPYVTLKWAESALGYMGGKLSSPTTQMLVHRLRSRVDGIMVGTETMLTDKPSLTNRLWAGKSPLPITIDRHGRVPEQLKEGFLVYTDESLQEILSDLHARGIQHLLVEGGARLHKSFIREGLFDEIRIERTEAETALDPKAPDVQKLLFEGVLEGDGTRYEIPVEEYEKEVIKVDKSEIITYKKPLGRV